MGLPDVDEGHGGQSFTLLGYTLLTLGRLLRESAYH